MKIHSVSKLAVLGSWAIFCFGCGGSGSPTGGGGGGASDYIQQAISLEVFSSSRSSFSANGVNRVHFKRTSVGSTDFYTPQMTVTLNGTPIDLLLPSSAPNGATVRSTNNSGNIVGSLGLDGGGSGGLYWESSTSAPVNLITPLGGFNRRYVPWSINASKQILSLDDAPGDNPVWYYASPTATPVKVADRARTIRIADNGAIFVSFSDVREQVKIYFAPAFTPITPTPAAGYDKFEIRNVCASDGSLVGISSLGTDPDTTRATIYTTASYNTPIILPLPPGARRSFADHINSSHMVVGEYLDANTVYRKCIWPTPTSQPINLPLSTSGANIGITQLFDGGSFLCNVLDGSSTYLNLTPKP
jgi:hypothetical protein